MCSGGNAVMSDAQPTITPPPLPGRKNKYQEMARASWLAPIICFAVNAVLIPTLGNKDTGVDKVRMIVGPLFIVVGLLLGVTALFSIRKHGKGGILGPAITGISINLLLIVLGLLPVLYFKANRAHLQPAFHSPTA